MDIQVILSAVNQLGIGGAFLVMSVGLAWWILHRTRPRESYELLQQQIDEQRSELQELRHECKETIIPTIGRMADIQQKQLEVMQETLHHVNQLEDRFDEVYRLDAPGGRRYRRNE